MNKSIALILTLAGAGMLLGGAAHAQDTNLWPLTPTRLETIETNTGVVILKATGEIGSLNAEGAVVTVKCREITELAAGQREAGVVIGIQFPNEPEEVSPVDGDELEGLLGALDYLNRIDWTVTPLSGFSASYTSRGGFRVVAFGSRHAGTIEFAVRNVRFPKRPVRLSRAQVEQLRSLVEQARSKLVALHPKSKP
jgi:hypothetical protein